MTAKLNSYTSDQDVVELLTAGWDMLTNPEIDGLSVGEKECLSRGDVGGMLLDLAQRFAKPCGWLIQGPSGAWSFVSCESTARDARANGWAVQTLIAA